MRAKLKYNKRENSQGQEHVQQCLHFQRQMLKSLRARSQANQLRLQNEINFVRLARLLHRSQR